ncbi:tuberin-like isoform X4 [Portunus trituberculatus]|uniref:tuberin-like isoform X4 n=2 Tax=Portunus trituberculatus TaxID=210409 RepID=UPI001E1CB7BF|nr:tuberin-like isoform X4 [Portunus trituberculatus]
MAGHGVAGVGVGVAGQGGTHREATLLTSPDRKNLDWRHLARPKYIVFYPVTHTCPVNPIRPVDQLPCHSLRWYRDVATMSKDSKGDKSFPERLKRWFKIERGNAPGARDIRLTEEIKLELSSSSPAAVRLKAIRELTEVLAARKLEEYGIEKLWTLVSDLLFTPCPAEHRHTTLHMLTTLAAGHDRLGPMRHVFYDYIAKNYLHEDTKPIFDFFREVIAEGKQLEYIDEYVGPFLLDWLPGLLASPQAADALNLIIVLVKFNSAYLDEPVVTGFVKQVVIQLHRASCEAEALLCLRVLDAVLAYSYLPSSALPTFITALTRAVNVPQLTAESWRIMRNLLGTHLGNSGLFVLCRLIQSNCDAHMIRGGIFFVTSALWGPNKVSSLHYKPAAVLPNLREAAKNNHVLVVYEIALSMQKLASRMYLELHFSSWDLILDILNSLFEHTVVMEDGTEKQTIQGLLREILDAIEQLHDLRQFGGSAEKFFTLIDKYSHLRPESSVMRLLDHLALRVDPLRPHWLANLGTLLNQYFRRDSRPNVRTKALAILSDVYNRNRSTYGIEMVRNVITIQMEGIEKEEDVGVRTAAVNLLVHIALTQKSEVVPDILNLLENIVMAPYQGRSGTVQVVRESEAADTIAAVAGLIRIFKKKLWTLPSSHAIQAYGILISCLECHYRTQSILDGVPRVRQQIFEMLFDMRANSKYQLGFSKMPDRPGELEKDSIASLVPPFSPYIVVDHKHGQRLHLTRQKDSGEGEEEEEEIMFGKADLLVLPMCTSAVRTGYRREDKEYVQATEEETSAEHKVEITHLSLTQSAMIVIVAMKKEKDWEVLRMILERVPQVLQNKALILSRDANDIDYFAATLCSLITEKSLGLPESLHNTPTKFTRSDFQSYVFPVLASLASYHMHMDPIFQQKVIKCLEMGVVSRCAGPLCVSALTLCVLEMRDSMIRLLRDVMLSLSKITATVQNAQPILEFISTFLHLPKVYASFVSEQYMSIFAIAIPYTNPFKFNHYIVSLAYHVIAMWFLKCRLPFRRAFVQFITKNLSIILSNEDANTRRRSASASTGEQAQGKGDEMMIQFHNDLLETIVDLMARYTYASCAPLPKRSSVAKMLIEGGQEQTWILGNKIITVTTSGCGQRPMRNGLCDKCIQLCRKENNTAPPESSTPNPNTASRRRHRSELHRTISHEAKYKPQSKDDLHMRSIIRDLGDGITPLDQDPAASWSSGGFGEAVPKEPSSEPRVPSGSVTGAASATASACAAAIAAAAAAEEERRPRLCACWCMGWAEIHVRQPTGNMSWMMRIQNEQQLLPLGMDELPLFDLSSLFSPTSSSPSQGSSVSAYSRRKIGGFPMEDQKNEELLSQNFEELRPRAFSGGSDKTQDSDPGSQKDLSGYSSGALSHNSSDPKINTIDAGDDTRESSPIINTATTTSGENLEDPRVPVQRCHSSPEMSEGVVVGGEESSLSCEDRPPASPSPASPMPEMSPSPPALNRAKLSPRFENVIDGNTGSSSPPPVASSRVRHTSALQMPSGGSNSSISSGGGQACSNAEGEDSGSPRPLRRDRVHTISDMNPASRKLHLKSAAAAKKNSMKDVKPGISPSFVFLQLYYLGKLGGNNIEKPVLLPTHLPEMQRAMRVLDLIRPQETHKIGVLYVGRGQHTEQEILRNSFGSLRYMLFLQGLGSVLELSAVSEDEVFLGGLDAKGSDGKHVCIWHDDVMQVVFHVATMMPTKESDPNCNGKKRHIGNNYVTIVYNESGQPYSINTIKGQFNHTTVEVVPGDHSTNSVGVLCRPELADFVGGGGSPRLVSDTNLPILVRQIALHADLASTIWESLNRPPHSPYASNWLERLRKIRKIKQMVTDTEGTPPNLMDFTDMVDADKWEKSRAGGSGYWQQFLA